MRPLSVPTVTRRVGAAAAGVVLLAGLFPATAQAAPDQKPVQKKTVADSSQQRRADYDSRESLGAAAAAQPTAALRSAVVPTASPSAVNKLRDSLGVQGIVDVDSSTGTPRRVARLDGFLTGPASRSPARSHLTTWPLTRMSSA